MIALGLAATVLLLACKKLNDDLTPEINSKSNSNEKAPYIIVLKSLSKELGQRAASITARRNANRSKLATGGPKLLKQIATEDMATVADVLVTEFTYANLGKEDLMVNNLGGTMNSFAARLTAAQAEQIRKDPQVHSVTLTTIGTTSDVPSAGSEIQLGAAPNTFTLTQLSGGATALELWTGLDADFPTQVRAPFFQEIRDWSINAVGGLVDGTQSTTAQVWVFDSGLDTGHVDLQYNRNLSFNFVYTTAEGGIYQGPYDQTTVVDNNGHGSHVSGIIAAKRSNNVGTWGLSNKPVNMIKIGDADNDGAISIWEGNIYFGLTALWDNNLIKSGDIVNMSLGFSSVSKLIDSVMRVMADGGVKFVVAAGNSAITAGNATPHSAGKASSISSKNATFRAPNGTSFTHYKNIYVVSAIDWNREFAGSYSNRGNVITIAAPGTRILSASRYGRYAIKTGTSMAAPIVTALLLNANGALYVPANNFVSKIWRPGQVGDPPSITGPLVTNDPDSRRDCIIKKRSAYASMANQTFKAED